MGIGDYTEALQISHLAKKEITSIVSEVEDQNLRLLNLQKINSCLKDLLKTNDKNIADLQKKKRYSALIITFLAIIGLLAICFVKINYF